MKLTDNQKDALQYIYNDGGIDEENTLIHKHTINSLYRKNLVTYFYYANCTMVQLTDGGLRELELINQ